MVWYVLLALAAVIALLQLGALSVWVSIFKILLLALLAVVLAVGVYFGWRHFSKRT